MCYHDGDDDVVDGSSDSDYDYDDYDDGGDDKK